MLYSTIIHDHTLLYTFIHCYTLLYTIIHDHTLLYTVIHSYLVIEGSYSEVQVFITPSNIVPGSGL